MAVLGSIGGFGRGGGVIPRSPLAPRPAPVFRPVGSPQPTFVGNPGLGASRPFYGIPGGPIPAAAPGGTGNPGGPGDVTGLQNSISFGGYTPDYASLLRADPGYMATHNAIEQMLKTAEARKNSAIGQLKYDFGDYMNPDKNPESFVARNIRSLRAAQQANLQNVLARGAGRSSDEANYLEGGAQQDYRSADYDASKALAQAIQQQVYGYQDTQANAASQDAQAIAQAYQALQANPLYQARVPTQASLVTDWQKYGEPVYRDESGRIWTQSGQPWQPRPGYPGA